MAYCFVIMPFRPELRFLYERMKGHLEDRFPGLEVERGDDAVMTRPLLEKIREMITNAEVVVADCTQRNPNVFYELGMAHALDRNVILITCDPPEEVPTDIRAYELISYAGQPENFLAKLDLAFESLLGDPYADLYEPALVEFQAFRAAAHLTLAPVPKAQFLASAKSLSRRPPEEESRERSEYLIRRLLGVDAPIEVFNRLTDWLNDRFPNTH